MFVGILYLDNQNPFPAVFSCVTLVKATASGRQCCELQWSQTWSGNRIITLWRGQGGRIGRGREVAQLVIGGRGEEILTTYVFS